MEVVLVEREFEAPQPFDTFVGADSYAPGCLDLHQTTPRGSLVAVDERRMVCLAVAPDAESVRIPLDMYNVPYARLWTADVHRGALEAEEILPVSLVPAGTPAGDAMPYRVVMVVVGRLPPPVPFEPTLARATALLGSDATHLFSYTERAGGTYVGIFDRPDPKPVARDGLEAWPAHVRTKKRHAAP